MSERILFINRWPRHHDVLHWDNELSQVARVDPGSWRLPLAERPFGSLFQLQEGAHLGARSATSGYATDSEEQRATKPKLGGHAASH